MAAEILPFRRPHLVIFERFDPDDMAAMFRAKRGSDTYIFTLLPDGELEDAFIRREHDSFAEEEFDDEQREQLDKFVQEARDVYSSQLSTWSSLNATDRLALLITWSEDTVAQIKKAIRKAAQAMAESVPDEYGYAESYSEEILLMSKDLECHEAYLAALKTAKTLF